MASGSPVNLNQWPLSRADSCQGRMSVSAFRGLKVTEHEVPEGDAPKVVIRITRRPLTFPVRRSITLEQIGGEISSKKNITWINNEEIKLGRKFGLVANVIQRLLQPHLGSIFGIYLPWLTQLVSIYSSLDGTTNPDKEIVLRFMVSIHVPTWGANQHLYFLKPYPIVSIHAPLGF